MAKKTGRPTLYKDEYPELLIKHFDIPPYFKTTKQVFTKSGVCEVEVLEPNDFPTLAGFAIKIGVCRDSLHEWANKKDKDGNLKHPLFSDAYKKVSLYQENYLVTNGLRGIVNTAFAIFTAKNVLGWRDKKEIEVNDTNVEVQTKALSEVGTKIIKAIEKWNG